MGKRYAANRVVDSRKRTIINGVVTLTSIGTVDAIGRLTEELPYTIWIGGTIEIVQTTKGLQAFKDGKLLV